MDIDEQEMDSGQTLGEQMEDWQKNNLVERALASLNPDMREMIVLSRFHQLNYEEIADMHGCNLNTLKSRIRKALSVLQDTYQQLAGESVQ